MELNQAFELVLELADANTIDDFTVGNDPHLEEMQKEQDAAIERVGEFLQYRLLGIVDEGESDDCS